MGNASTKNLPAKIGGSGLIVRNNDDLHTMVHAAFNSDQYNILVPKALNFGPGIKLAIQILELDSDIDDDTKRSKDFWSIDGKEFILSANAIRKIAGAANIQWDPDKCRIEDQEYNDKNEILRVRYKAVCRVTTSLGNSKIGIGTYEYNYANDLKDYRFQKKEKRGNKYVPTGELKWNQINQRRQFAIQLVESGAKARAIYDALGILERTFKKTNISKPFVIPSALDDIDYTDPEIRRMVAGRALGIEQQLYGPGRAVKAPYEIQDSPEPQNGTDSPPEKPTREESPSEGPPDETKSAEPTPAEVRAIFEDEWRGSTADARGQKIIDLVKKTGDDISKYKRAPKEWGIEIQMKWIMGLAAKAGEIPKEAADA